jgi:hypothetical protein
MRPGRPWIDSWHADANLAIIGWDARHGVEDFDIELENREEIPNSGIQPPTKVSIQIRNTSTFKRDEFVLPSWESASKLSTHHDADLIFRILRLLRHSILEDDEYDRFSKISRGFNAFYNSRSTQPSEASRIRKFAQKVSPSLAYSKGWLATVLTQYCTALPNPTSIDDYLTLVLTRRNWSCIMDSLVKRNLVNDKGVNHSQNLANAVAAKNLPSILESALLCLYVERNKVMHGEIISDDERDLLYVCASFLQRIVAIALNEFYFIPLKTPQP